MSRSNEIFIGELERAYIFHTSYNSLEERRVWIVRNKNRNVDNIKDKLPFRIERTFNDFSEVVASISKGDNIERIIFSLADVPQKDIVKVFGNFEVIFPNYEKMMKKINKPVIAITTSTKGAGKSAVTLTYATYFKNKNIPLIVATYPEFNGKFDSSITHSVIKTEEDIKNSPFVIESSEFKPYLSLNIPVYVGIDYTTLNNTKTEIVIWGICKGSTEPPLIKPDVYITVVDLGREAWDYISYPGIYNLRNSHIIFLNKANIFKNSLKEQLIMQELKEINPNAEIIKVRQVEIGDDTSIVVPEDEKINIYEILGCYIKGI